MQWCPWQLSLLADHGLNRCSYELTTSAVLAVLAVVAGSGELLLYKRYASRVPAARINRSCGARLQYALPVAMLLLCCARLVIEAVQFKIVYAYQIAYTVLTCSTWIWTLLLLFAEGHYLLPSVPTRGHGAVLLLVWTLSLGCELMALLSFRSKQWWFLLRLGSDQWQLMMWAGRLFFSGCMFYTGLRGHVTNIRYTRNEAAAAATAATATSSASEDLKSTWSNLREKIRIVLPYIWPRRSFGLQLRAVACIVILILARVINLLIPLYCKYIVDSLTPVASSGGKNTSISSSTRSEPFYLLRLKPGPDMRAQLAGLLEFRYDLILIYVGLKTLQGVGTGGSGLLGSLRNIAWIRVEQYTMREISLKLFSHLQGLSLKWHLSKKTGEVLRVMDRGVNSVNSLLSYLLFNIVPTLIDITIGISYFTAYFNAWFGVLVFFTMVLFMYISIAITEWRTKFRRQMNKLDNEKSAKAVDALLNFETVKYYAAEPYETDRYRTAIVNYQKAEYLTVITMALLNSAQNFIISGGFLAGTLLCAFYIVQHANGDTTVPAFTVGDYVLFTTYIMQLYVPLNWFATYYRIIQQQFIDMENMFELLNVDKDIVDKDSADDLIVERGQIEFDNVSFSYESGKQVLKNVSFSVPAGATVALVGHSGAGKSSVLRLVFRFYDLCDGRILIDGQDISCVKQASLRRAIGVVPQDTVLFNADIRYNIRYGRPDTSDYEVEEAARLADIHERIMNFPNGYDTVVGERGLKLSGGEKQRVAIARTLLKAPKIVLLDEATSALDTATERNIQASLDQICDGRTTLVVAHRLSTIVNAQLILVMHEGCIIERGSHDRLLAADGAYASMWLQQQKKQQQQQQQQLLINDDAVSDAE